MPVNIKLLAAQIVGMFVIIGAALFIAAGTLAWLEGWAFLLLFFGFTVALSRWLVAHNPALLTERMTGIGKADQKSWDKLFFVLANIVFLAWLIEMPLDAVRFGWSHMPGWLQMVGAALLLGSFYLFFLVFRENSYLSSAVRVQTERAQTVVSTGPYRYVRHPMYAAALVFFGGATLLLGAWYGLLLVLALALCIAWRALQEEQTLCAELPGYDAYQARVRYHLVPFVW